jgi:phage terminase large subunit-like protein
MPVAPQFKTIKAAENPGDRAVRFINNLTLSTGQATKLRLRDWQEFIIRTLFGTLRPDGLRQFRKLLLLIPRKNGKTELIAAICLFCLLADGERGAEIYSAAKTKEQAARVYKAAAAMVHASPKLSAICDCLDATKTIIVRHGPMKGNLYRALASEAGAQHGLNASVVVFDEVHQGDKDLWDVLATSQGARRQPLFLAISTAGVYDPHSLLYEQYKQAKQGDHYLNGTLVKGGLSIPTLLAFIYEAPKDADWTDEAVWKLCNPALGDFRGIEEMRDACAEAQRIPSKQTTFRQLYLNQWTESVETWIPADLWLACTVKLDRAALKGKPCFLGLDLSSKRDLTALVALFPDGNVIKVLPMFFIPEERISERVKRDGVPYDVWSREHRLIATPGNVVDYAYIRRTINEWAEEFDVQMISVDPWNSTQLVTELEQDGHTVVEVRQGFASLSGPSKSFEKHVVGKTLEHDGNPVMTWCVKNAAVERDAAENIKPSKKVSTERIDGVVALVMALDALERNPIVQQGAWYFDQPEAQIFF